MAAPRGTIESVAGWLGGGLFTTAGDGIMVELGSSLPAVAAFALPAPGSTFATAPSADLPMEAFPFSF